MKKHASLLVSLLFLFLNGCGSSNEESGTNASPTFAQATGSEGLQPWMNPALPPADRAEALLAAMTIDQKIQQLYNLPVINTELQDESPPCEFQRVGRHIEGIPELHIPTFRFANGGTGIRGGDCLPEPTATALPSGVAATATNFEALWLRGTSLSASAGQTLAGIVIDNEGNWVPPAAAPLTATNGQLTVMLPPVSAVLLRSL